MRKGADKPILVVEDDDATRRLFANVFADEHWPTLLAADGEQAVRRAMREPPRLVLLDMHLPGRSALHVARQLRRLSGSTLPIIVTSASSERLAAALLGASAFLAKPFELDALVRLVRSVLELSERGPSRYAGLRNHADAAVRRLNAARERLDLRTRSMPAPSTEHGLLKEVVQVSGARAGSLVLTHARYTLQLAATLGFPPELSELWEEFPADAQVPIADAVQGESIWMRTLEEGLPRYPNLLGPLATTPWAEAMCTVPLRCGHTSVGAIGLIFGERQEFGQAMKRRILDGAENAANGLGR